MGVDDITERIRGMNINKNVGFKHSIYGIIRRGGDKGKEAEIREYYPSKYDVMLDIRGYISIGKDMKAGDKIMECEVISEVERIGDMVKYLVSCKKMILFSKKNTDYSFLKTIVKIPYINTLAKAICMQVMNIGFLCILKTQKP